MVADARDPPAVILLAPGRAKATALDRGAPKPGPAISTAEHT